MLEKCLSLSLSLSIYIYIYTSVDLCISMHKAMWIRSCGDIANVLYVMWLVVCFVVLFVLCLVFVIRKHAAQTTPHQLTLPFPFLIDFGFDLFCSSSAFYCTIFCLLVACLMLVSICFWMFFLASCWCHLGVILGSFWVSFWGHVGVIFGYLTGQPFKYASFSVLGRHLGPKLVPS